MKKLIFGYRYHGYSASALFAECQLQDQRK